jgi:myo-inositol-1(or 4)-monophosphatase
MLSPHIITETLNALCSLAEKETLARFRQKIPVDNKLASGFDPVTEADRAAETVIRNYLITHFPDHGIIGEEEDDINPQAEYCWIIDPVDGTRSFICGLPGWGTLIGLLHKGVPVAGVMHQPFTKEKFITRGDRSFLDHAGRTEQLQTSSETSLSNAIMMSTTPELFTGVDLAAFSAVRSASRLVRYGFDCYAYAMVAAGHIELVMENKLKAFDIAPLIPLIERAGGIVTTWEGGSAASGGRILACANQAIHRQALELIANIPAKSA